MGMDYGITFVVGTRVKIDSISETAISITYHWKTGEKTERETKKWFEIAKSKDESPVTIFKAESQKIESDGYPVSLKDFGVDSDLSYIGGEVIIGRVFKKCDSLCAGNSISEVVPTSLVIARTVLGVKESLRTLGIDTDVELFAVLRVSC